MRKKQNIQQTDYAKDGELMCFGISEHSLTENLPKLSEKAQKEAELLSGWILNNEKTGIRPAHKSDTNIAHETTRAQLRVGLAILAFRELPIKSFAARWVVLYLAGHMFINKGLGKGIFPLSAAYFYESGYIKKMLLNYPDINSMLLTKRLPKNLLGRNPHDEWRYFQQPVYHQYHKCTFR